MSAPDRSSIPTSSDPRSHRPLKKKRALSPTSSQASHLSHLFAHPEIEIKLPAPPTGPMLPAPPEIVTNVQGSSAGAGSGEFHVYKAARRREYERLRIMDEETARERAAAEFDAAKREREARDEEKTRKNREKREKKKLKQKQGGNKQPQQQQQQQQQGKKVGGEENKSGAAAAANAAITSGDKENATAATVEKDGAAKDGAKGAGATGDQASTGTGNGAGLTTVLQTATDGPGLVIHDED